MTTTNFYPWEREVEVVKVRGWGFASACASGFDAVFDYLLDKLQGTGLTIAEIRALAVRVSDAPSYPDALNIVNAQPLPIHAAINADWAV